MSAVMFNLKNENEIMLATHNDEDHRLLSHQRDDTPFLPSNAWIEAVLATPLRSEVQANGRIRRWGFIAEEGKYLRVVTEADGETVHNAFFDRNFKL